MTVIRIRSPNGMFRFTVDGQDRIDKLIMLALVELKKKDVMINNPQLFRTPIKPTDKNLNPFQTIAELKLTDGELLQLQGSLIKPQVVDEQELDRFEAPAIKYKIPPCSLHGKGQSCVRCMMAGYIRVDRTEKRIPGVKADKRAVAVFQYNIRANLAYSVERLGIMYGKKQEDGWFSVDFIYEPPQENTPDCVLLHPSESETKSVEAIATSLGLIKVGCIIGQTATRCEDEEFILTANQLLMIAELKGTVKDFVILCVGTRPSRGTESVIEAFELTEQFYDLYDRKYFKRPQDDFFLQVKEPLWIEAKEEFEAEVEFFITPISLTEYQGNLKCEFPVENRNTPQSTDFVKRLIESQPRAALIDLLKDFHLLLFLSSIFGQESVIQICNEIFTIGALSEGFEYMVKDVAGLI